MQRLLAKEFILQNLGTFGAIVVIFTYSVLLDRDLDCTCKPQTHQCCVYLLVPVFLIWILILWTRQTFLLICRRRYCYELRGFWCRDILKSLLVGLLWMAFVWLDGDWYVCCWNDQSKQQAQLACKTQANLTYEDRVIIAELKNSSRNYGIGLLAGIICLAAAMSWIRCSPCCEEKLPKCCNRKGSYCCNKSEKGCCKIKEPIDKCRNPNKASPNVKSPNTEASSSSTDVKSPNTEASSSSTDVKSPNTEASSSSTDVKSPNTEASSSSTDVKSPNTEASSYCCNREGSRCCNREELRCCNREELRCCNREGSRCCNREELRCCNREGSRCCNREELRCCNREELRCCNREGSRCCNDSKSCTCCSESSAFNCCGTKGSQCCNNVETHCCNLVSNMKLPIKTSWFGKKNNYYKMILKEEHNVVKELLRESTKRQLTEKVRERLCDEDWTECFNVAEELIVNSKPSIGDGGRGGGGGGDGGNGGDGGRGVGWGKEGEGGVENHLTCSLNSPV